MNSPLLMEGEFIAYYPALAKRLGGQPLRAIIVQALWFRRDRQTDETRMSYDGIGDMVGASSRTIERQVKWLIENGYLSQRRASAADATSVFGVIVSALTSENAPTLPTKTASRTPRSVSSNPAIGVIEDDKVATSAAAPIPTPAIGVLDHDNLSSSDHDNVAGSTTSKNLKKSSTPSDGFREFWSAFPDGGYKYRKEECRKIWHGMSIDERHAAWNMLMAYKNSVLWVEQEKIPTPFQWLTNETWTSDKPRQVPPPVKYLTVDDIRLPD